jgi:PAS domain-containing protein
MADAGTGTAGGDAAAPPPSPSPSTSARASLAAGDPKAVARVFRALLARADDTVFAVVGADDGRVRYVSPSVSRLFGVSVEEHIGACHVFA